MLTFLLGLVLIIAGIVMLFTPGSGIAVIILGLWVWAREFAWARRSLDTLIDKVEERREKLPAFVGRVLDERRRRREIREMADEAATTELDVIKPEPADHEPVDRTISPGRASDEGA